MGAAGSPVARPPLGRPLLRRQPATSPGNSQHRVGRMVVSAVGLGRGEALVPAHHRGLGPNNSPPAEGTLASSAVWLAWCPPSKPVPLCSCWVAARLPGTGLPATAPPPACAFALLPAQVAMSIPVPPINPTEDGQQTKYEQRCAGDSGRRAGGGRAGGLPGSWVGCRSPAAMEGAPFCRCAAYWHLQRSIQGPSRVGASESVFEGGAAGATATTRTCPSWPSATTTTRAQGMWA